MSEEQLQAVEESEEVIEEQSQEQDSELEEQSSEEGVELSSEQKEELTEEIKEAQAKGESKQQIQKRIEKFILDVNGKQYVREIDLDDKETIKRELQKSLAGQQSMQKYRELEKSLQEENQNLLQNPFKLFEKAQELGVDPQQLAYEFLQAQLAEAEKDPEIKAREEMEQKLAEAERKREEAEARQREMEMRAIRQQEAAAFEEELLDIIRNDDELEYTPKVVKEMINTLIMFDKMGHKDLSFKDIVPTVKYKLEQEMNSLMNSYASKGNWKMLERLVGRQNFEAWRKNQVDSIKNNPSTIESKVKKQAPKQEKTVTKTKKVSQGDFLKRFM